MEREEEIAVELTEVKRKYQTLQEEHEKVASALSASQGKCEKMLVKLKAFKTKNDSLQLEIENLKNQGSLPETEVTDKADDSKKSAELQEVITALKLQLDTEKEKLAVVSTRKDALEEISQQLKEADTEMKTRCSNQEKDINELKNYITKLQTENEEKECKLLELSKEHQEQLYVSDENVKLQQELNNAQSLRKDLSDKLLKLSDENQQVKGELTVLQGDLATAQQHTKDAERKLSDSVMLCDSLEAENKNYQEIITRLKTTNAGLEKDKFELSKAMSKMQEENVDTSASGSDELQKLRNQIQDLEAEKDQMMEEIDGFKEDFNEINKEKKIQKEELDDVNSKLKEVYNEKKDLQRKIDGQQWRIEELEAFEQELEETQSELDKVKMDLAAKTSSLDELQNEDKKQESSIVQVQHVDDERFRANIKRRNLETSRENPGATKYGRTISLDKRRAE